MQQLTPTYDEDPGENASTDQTQPLRWKTRSMPQDIGSGQDSPATTSIPSLPSEDHEEQSTSLGW